MMNFINCKVDANAPVEKPSDIEETGRASQDTEESYHPTDTSEDGDSSRANDL